MLDDQRDKEMMRNQLIAIILMTLLVVAWFHYYGPKPPRQPAQPQSTPADRPATEDVPSEAERGAEPAATPEAAAGTQWPYLPPVPTQEDPAQDEVTIENAHLRLVFTRIGARLKRAFVLLGNDGHDVIQLVPTYPEDILDTEALYPMGLRFTHETIGDALDWRRFDVEPDPSGQSVTFSLTLPDVAVVRKTFVLSDRPYVVNVQVVYENIEAEPQVLGMDQTPAFSLNWGPNVTSGDEKKFVKQAVYWFKDGLLEGQNTVKLTPRTIHNAEWIAIKSAYFAVALKPNFDDSRAWTAGNPKQFRIGLSVPRFEVAPRQTHTAEFAAFIGPSLIKALATAWDTLPEVQRVFKSVNVMDRFAKLLLTIMNWFYDHVFPNYGFAIIFLTVVVRVVMYPLTLKSMRSMKKMQLLAPEIETLKEKHGKDPQEMNKKMMELYKERGVNPMGGCFPMLLQMPVFIALYRMLAIAFELRGAPFVFWITDLSEPDQLFHIPALANIPFVSMLEYINLLPILMGLAMVLSQKLMPVSGAAQNPQQKFMMTFMPIFFCFICYRMASGLSLYILTSTLLGIVQQKLTRAGDVDIKPKKKTPRRHQHFYTAAQERKRRLAREAKHERRGKQAGSSGASIKNKGLWKKGS